MITLLIGGARSGKSDLAVEIGAKFTGDVTFIATASRVDDDMTRRITRHQADRPDWPLIEAPLELEQALARVDDRHLAIVDCLTLWLSNAMLSGWDHDEIDTRAAGAANVAARRSGPTVAVTNEVGLGVHPETELGREFRDLLGRVNQRWAEVADRSLFLIAGRAVALVDPWELLR